MVFSCSPSLAEEADLGGGMLRRFRGSPTDLLPEADAESGTEEAVQLLDILDDDEDGFGASGVAAFNGSKSSSKTREERTSLEIEDMRMI